jgi:predicted O-linked N-acetylglucosamine transferase (SPINDLY family)
MQQMSSAVLQLLGEGDRHFRAGRLAEAVGAYQRAIGLQPNLPHAYHNLGMTFRHMGRSEEAVACYRQAVALRPYAPELHNNLANALRDLGRLDEAAAAYRHALAIRPTDAEVHNNLGAILQMQGKLDAAIASFRQAIALKPALAETLSNLIYTSKMACDWRGLDAYEEKCRAAVRAGARQIVPFHFLSIETSPAEQLQCARQFASARTKGMGRLPAPPRMPKDRLRLGYLSAKFHQHPSSVLTAELFERHDRSRFELFAYAIGPDDGSAMRRRLERGFDHFHDIRALSHGDAAKRMRDDGIDVLVDLTGYNDDERLPILAWRPAPIQVNFLGYPGTLGAPFIDYVVADPIALPMSDQPFFTEKIVQLPDCYQPNDSKREIAARTPTRAECGLPNEGIVFCCFNQSYKITAAMFDIWMKLLRGLPGSVLWLLDSNPAVQPHLVREANARGVAADRLVFAPRLPLAEHLARHRVADLFLDTLPYNAHTTASDALWAGLPVLTCAGNCFAGRVAASLLAAVGLPELVTHSLEDYERLAVRLAREPALLGSIRDKLRVERATALLFDTGRFAANLERAYLRMWELWAAGKPPEAFALARETIVPATTDRP